MKPILYSDLSQHFGPDVSLPLSSQLIAVWCGLNISTELKPSDVTSQFDVVSGESPNNFRCERRAGAPVQTVLIDTLPFNFILPSLWSQDNFLQVRSSIQFASWGWIFDLECAGKDIDTPIIINEDFVANWSTFRQGLVRENYTVTSLVDIKDSRNYSLSVVVENHQKSG